MWTLETLLIISVTFLLAGFVKGVVGLGLPTVSLALLTTTLGLHAAMALLIIPSLVTNAWQAAVGGHALMITRRIFWFLLCAMLFIWPGSWILSKASVAVMTQLLGVLLITYSLISLSQSQALRALSKPYERWLALLSGVLNGLFTGMTGSFVVPSVLYLQALGLSRDAFVQAMGIVFTLSTLALMLALAEQRLLSAETSTISALAIVPAIIGMIIGQKVRRRLSETRFKQVLFSALLIIGLFMLLGRY